MCRLVPEKKAARTAFSSHDVATKMAMRVEGTGEESAEVNAATWRMPASATTDEAHQPAFSLAFGGSDTSIGPRVGNIDSTSGSEGRTPEGTPFPYAKSPPTIHLSSDDEGGIAHHARH